MKQQKFLRKCLIVTIAFVTLFVAQNTTVYAVGESVGADKHVNSDQCWTSSTPKLSLEGQSCYDYADDPVPHSNPYNHPREVSAICTSETGCYYSGKCTIAGTPPPEDDSMWHGWCKLDTCSTDNDHDGTTACPLANNSSEYGRGYSADGKTFIPAQDCNDGDPLAGYSDAARLPGKSWGGLTLSQLLITSPIPKTPISLLGHDIIEIDMKSKAIMSNYTKTHCEYKPGGVESDGHGNFGWGTYGEAVFILVVDGKEFWATQLNVETLGVDGTPSQQVYNDFQGWGDQHRYIVHGPLANNNEDLEKIITAVQNNKKISIRILQYYKENGTDNGVDYKRKIDSFDIPLTNISLCTPISGTGSQKVVFMRDADMNPSDPFHTPFNTVAKFISLGNSYITYGFNAVDPFKKYISRFSFYADLAHHSSQDLSPSVSVLAVTNTLKQVSSCGNNIFANAYVTNSPGMRIGDSDAYARRGERVVIINELGRSDNWAWGDTDEIESLVLMHELGHAVAGLWDEYKSSYEQLTDTRTPDRNCTTNPARDYKYNNIYYGAPASPATEGCSFSISPMGSKYYRPSGSSLMRQGPIKLTENGVAKSGTPWLLHAKKFSVIDCGYLMAAIQTNAINPTKEQAEVYWPACAAMDTDKVELPSIQPVIYLQKLENIDQKKGIWKVTGTGFTPTGNSVKLIPKLQGSFVPFNSTLAFSRTLNELFAIPTAHAADITPIEIHDLSSTDGTSITFTVPTTVPNGAYTISVGNSNSPWADSLYTVNVSNNGVPPTATTTTVSLLTSATMVDLGKSFTLTYSSTNAASCTNNWDYGSKTSGTSVQYPRVSKVYIFSCKSSTGTTVSAQQSITLQAVATLPVIVPTTTTTPQPGQKAIINNMLPPPPTTQATTPAATVNSTPSPSPTVTATATYSPSPTSSATPSANATPTPSATVSSTSSPTTNSSSSPSSSPSSTTTATPTPTSTQVSLGAGGDYVAALINAFLGWFR